MSIKLVKLLYDLHDVQGQLSGGLDNYKKLEKATRINVGKLNKKDVKKLPEDKDFRGIVLGLQKREKYLRTAAKMTLPPEARLDEKQLIKLDTAFQKAADSPESGDVETTYKELKTLLDSEVKRLTKQLDPFRLAVRFWPKQRDFYNKHVKYTRHVKKAFLKAAEIPQELGTGKQATWVALAKDTDDLSRALSIHVSAYDLAIPTMKKHDVQVRKHLDRLYAWQAETEKLKKSVK